MGQDSERNKDGKPYRPNVGIVVFNSKYQVLAGERLNWPGVFQFPQGGIDPGEDPAQAATRELYEETGLRITTSPAGQLDEWIYYDFPEDIPEHLKQYAGQKQKWFFFYWDGHLDELQLDIHEQEFAQVRWMDIKELADNIVEFKKDTYNRLVAYSQNLWS